MERAHLEKLRNVYREGLLNDTVPFWLMHGMDAEHGGVTTCLDRDGTVIDTDKAIWPQGRFGWMLSTLYNTVEPREEWLAAAGSCVSFLERHAYDEDGRMYFLVTREGKPLRRRRYVFSESFAAIAYAAYAKATGDEVMAQRARKAFDVFVDHMTSPGLIPPKINPKTRPMSGLGMNMILLNTAQVIRDTIGGTLGPEGHSPEHWINHAIDEIQTRFCKTELRAVMEVVGEENEVLDHFDGRMLTPGHAIEAAWFILHEARVQNCAALAKLGTDILDWMWERGWDREHGGILYFVDVKGLPVQEYWHDMKFWWPHNETIIATLLAYHLTGDEKYATWHRMCHDWAYTHFPDPEYGEWFGYLHRDGSPSVRLKGNHWKGPFHLPRMQWYCWQLCEEMLATESRSEGEGAS